LLRKNDDKALIDFTTPIGISYSPFRVDRLTYSYSSTFAEEFRALFGEVKPPLPIMSKTKP
jgi:hypothetical protein